MTKINYKLLARIREAKEKPFLPPGFTINYTLLGEILEKKKENGTIL